MIFDVLREKKLASNIIMVDGFSGTGKSFLLPLLSHLNRSELWQISMGTERICILDYLNKIDRDAAIALIQMAFDERLYDLQLSRNVNFRAWDDSSVQNNMLYDKYNSRMNDKIEKLPIVKRIEQNGSILVMDVHYLFGYSDLYFKGLFEQIVSYIIMLRNPAHLIIAYFKQNIHQRILHDKMELTLCIKMNNQIIPYYAIEFWEEYLNANDLEKTILFAYNHSKKLKQMYDPLNPLEKEKILFIPFENISTNPQFYIDKICKQTNQEIGSDFHKIYEHLNLPRQPEPINFNLLQELLLEYSLQIKPKYMSMVDELIEEYKIILQRY